MEAPGFPVPARVHRVEEVIQRSRFLTALAHAPTPEAAHAFVQRMRDEHGDATHHCWAFVAGPPGSTTRIGMSDDGEPHGTAGRPMLTALLHGGVGEIVAVCVRWYGGTKLGTGGLARAYAGGVVAALKDLPTERKVQRARVTVRLGYAHVDGLRQLLDEVDGTLESEDYGAEVRYVVGVPEGGLDAFRRRLADLTAGEARVGDGE